MHTSAVHSIAWSPKCTRLAISTGNSKIYFWEEAGATCLSIMGKRQSTRFHMFLMTLWIASFHTTALHGYYVVVGRQMVSRRFACVGTQTARS